MIALTPAEIRLRRSAICSAGPPLRLATMTFETMPEASACGLDRADHFLAPAVADQRVGDADDKFVGGRRAAGERERAKPRTSNERQASFLTGFMNSSLGVSLVSPIDTRCDARMLDPLQLCGRPSPVRAARLHGGFNEADALGAVDDSGTAASAARSGATPACLARISFAASR